MTRPTQTIFNVFGNVIYRKQSTELVSFIGWEASDLESLFVQDNFAGETTEVLLERILH